VDRPDSPSGRGTVRDWPDYQLGHDVPRVVCCGEVLKAKHVRGELVTKAEGGGERQEREKEEIQRGWTQRGGGVRGGTHRHRQRDR
jgi:hypothetical protein